MAERAAAEVAKCELSAGLQLSSRLGRAMQPATTQPALGITADLCHSDSARSNPLAFALTLTKMETPQRYWSGLYWDGLDPEQIGAVSLSDASGDGDAVIDSALAAVRKLLMEAGEKEEDYCVSLIEMQPETEGDAEVAVAAAAAASSAAAPATVSLSDLSPGSICSGDCLVVRLWHMNVFIGARESATGDPGAQCRDVHFHPTTATPRHVLTLADTDALIDEQQ